LTLSQKIAIIRHRTRNQRSSGLFRRASLRSG